MSEPSPPSQHDHPERKPSPHLGPLAARDPDLTAQVPRHPTPDRDWTLILPPRPALLAFHANDRRFIHLLISADLRAAARRALSSPTDAGQPSDEAEHPPATSPEPSPPPTRSLAPDLAPVTTTIDAWLVGSSIEAEALYLSIARQSRTDLIEPIAQRWAVWYIEIEPHDRFPRWNLRSTTELDRQPTPPPGPQPSPAPVLLGPIRDRRSATRAIDTLNDLFDLCRDYTLLVLTPNATACTYKELGKCPAPCDGSEPLERYQARVREAIDFWIDAEPWRERANHAMATASADLNFELASSLRDRLAAAQTLENEPLAFARGTAERPWLLLASAPDQTNVRVLHASRSGLAVITDVSVEADDHAAWEQIHRLIPAPAEPHPTTWLGVGHWASRLIASGSPRSRRWDRIHAVPLPSHDNSPGEAVLKRLTYPGAPFADAWNNARRSFARHATPGPPSSTPQHTPTKGP